ncbi:transposase [Pseudomonadota bacterium]
MKLPRAKRTYVPGGIWHLTHRCHNREFLLKFERDRQRWCRLLFEAQKRYHLLVLNYIVTSNHIHLLVKDSKAGAIARSMQFVSGRLAQEYNRRKSRKGAFWEDRYFATAIYTDHYFIKCLVYIDMNMVRAAAVDHPAAWKASGYREIQFPRNRYRILDIDSLCALTESASESVFRSNHRTWVEHALTQGGNMRQPKWTEAKAVGPEHFTCQFDTRKERSKR